MKTRPGAYTQIRGREGSTEVLLPKVIVWLHKKKRADFEDSKGFVGMHSSHMEEPDTGDRCVRFSALPSQKLSTSTSLL